MCQLMDVERASISYARGLRGPHPIPRAATTQNLRCIESSARRATMPAWLRRSRGRLIACEPVPEQQLEHQEGGPCACREGGVKQPKFGGLHALEARAEPADEGVPEEE